MMWANWRLVWLIGLAVMVGCGEQSTQKHVEQKLAKIHQLPAVPIAVPLADEVVQIGDYQASNNPFLSPHQSMQTAGMADQSASSEPVMPTQAPRTDTPKPDTLKSDQAPSPKTIPTTPSLKAFGKAVSKPERMPSEPLEKYDLPTLRYQGRLTSGDWQVALIMSPDGLAHQVGVGQYLGRHHGRLARIDEHQLQIDEIHAQDEQYYQRTVFLPIGAK